MNLGLSKVMVKQFVNICECITQCELKIKLYIYIQRSAVLNDFSCLLQKNMTLHIITQTFSIEILSLIHI